MSRSRAMVVAAAMAMLAAAANVVAGLVLAVAVQVLAVPVAGLQASAQSLRPGGVFTRLSLLSTARQGRSGLGLEEQRNAIDGFAAARGAHLLARFTEVESGRKADRPELTRALNLAKLTGATLVIARLGRLSRNAAVLLTLRDSGVKFLAVDMPGANDLTVGIMALVAQAEREAISRRTSEALAVAKARGTRLGNPNGAAALRRAGKGGAPLRAAVTANADRFAADLAPVLADLRSHGITTLRALAAELNARGMRTRRGGRWHVSNVKNLLERLDRGCAGPAPPC